MSDIRTSIDCIVRPPLIPLIITIVALVVCLFLLFLALRLGGYTALFIKTCIFLIVIAILPTLISTGLSPWGQLVIVMTQALSATLATIVFVIWTIGLPSLGRWIGFLFALILVLLLGAYVLEWQKKRVLRSLTEIEKYPLTADETKRLENTMKRGLLLYLSIPLGGVIAIGYGWAMGASEVVAVVLIALVSLIGASIVLLLLLMTSASAMSNSLILIEPGGIEVSVIERPNPSFFAKFFTKFLKLRLPGVPEREEPDYTKGLDMAYAVSGLRRLYFYDSVHNCALLIGFSVAISYLIFLRVFSVRLVGWLESCFFFYSSFAIFRIP